MKSTNIAILTFVFGIAATTQVLGCRDSNDDEGAGGSGNGTNTGGDNNDGGTNNTGGDTSTGANGQGGNGECTPTGAEDTEEACTDGQDNDCDNFADCDDFNCSAAESCVQPAEASNPACYDGMDNDGDGDSDCEDIDCQGESIVVCDGTTPVDVDPADYEDLATAACTNGENDDGDMSQNDTPFTDCGDNECIINPDVLDCKGLPKEETNALCSNGDDDDKDGFVDCEEFFCQREGIVVCNGEIPVVVPPAQYQALAEAACSNGLNEDGNGFTDCDDFGCQINPDVQICPESGDAECSDGIDNDDTDDFVDCEDFSCSTNPYITVCGHELSYDECSDGVDNNGNPFADCNDFSCKPQNGQPSPACL